MAAFLGLIAAVTAALIARSVMTSNHRQAWINGLRDDLASFFTAIDLIHQTNDPAKSVEQQKARNEAMLAYRKILMRLNMNEPLHQQLDESLESLLATVGEITNQNDLTAAVKLARIILKREWEVTKYGLLAGPLTQLKAHWRRKYLSK
jgi:hypothetical protein